MGTFAVIAEHPPNLCPTSNAQTRQLLKEGASQIPQLAEQLGVDIGTLRIFGPDHIILVVAEADDIDSVRNLRSPKPPDAVEHGKDPCHLLDRRGGRDDRRGRGHLLGHNTKSTGAGRAACPGNRRPPRWRYRDGDRVSRAKRLHRGAIPSGRICSSLRVSNSAARCCSSHGAGVSTGVGATPARDGGCLTNQRRWRQATTGWRAAQIGRVRSAPDGLRGIGAIDLSRHAPVLFGARSQTISSSSPL